MDDYIIISNNKCKGWSAHLDKAKKDAKKMAKETGSGHAVYKYITTYEGESGKELN